MDLVLIQTRHWGSLIKTGFSDVGWAELALHLPSLEAVTRCHPICKLVSNICLNIGFSGES